VLEAVREEEQAAEERLQALLPAGQQRPDEELQLEASLAAQAQRLLASVSSETCRQVCCAACAPPSRARACGAARLHHGTSRPEAPDQ
jgi:hypothetical protein